MQQQNEYNNFETQNNSFPLQKPKPKLLNILLAGLVLLGIFGLGYVVGYQKVQVKSGRLEIVRGPERSADYNLLWEALDKLNSKYVDRQSLDQKKLMYGAVHGLLQAAGDPYTVFFDPEESKAFEEELKGSFDGIGAEMGTKDGQLVIIAPLPNTPASKAGLMPEDAILAINGESTLGLSVDKAVAKIRGPKGSVVTLTILHKGSNEPLELKITRDTISVKSVNVQTKEVDGKRIAVIEVARFGEDTKGLFDHAVDVVLSGNYQGVVIDLRSNPGGYLQTAVDIASNWIEQDKVVLKEVNYDGNIKDYTASGLSRLAGVKTVVLVNGGSASASEILGGALQDYKLATLVGEKTFGKGSVQELVSLSQDSSLKVTIAKWQTPNGRNIDKNGLEPDIKIERTPEDVAAQRDPQMDKALELLK